MIGANRPEATFDLTPRLDPSRPAGGTAAGPDDDEIVVEGSVVHCARGLPFHHDAAQGYPRAAWRTKNGRRRSGRAEELRRALNGCEVLFEMGEVLHV